MNRWFYQKLSNGRFFANNGIVKIYANSLDDRNRLINKYRHFKGIISQRVDGIINEIQI